MIHKDKANKFSITMPLYENFTGKNLMWSDLLGFNPNKEINGRTFKECFESVRHFQSLAWEKSLSNCHKLDVFKAWINIHFMRVYTCFDLIREGRAINRYQIQRVK